MRKLDEEIVVSVEIGEVLLRDFVDSFHSILPTVKDKQSEVGPCLENETVQRVVQFTQNGYSLFRSSRTS